MSLLFDCTAMTGYDAEARVLFVEWHREHGDKIDRVAIITENMLWHMIVGAMGLASGQRMRAFNRPEDAYDWLATG